MNLEAIYQQIAEIALNSALFDTPSDPRTAVTTSRLDNFTAHVFDPQPAASAQESSSSRRL